jgi:hypothetical protein
MVVYLTLAIVVVIILMFCAFRCGQTLSEMDLLRGFWESDNSFNKESGLRSFTFYIGDKIEGKYPAYMLMIESGDEQTLLINEPTTFTLSESYMNTMTRGECREMYIKFSNLDTPLLPNVLTMKFYPQTGKIVLADHSKIYAVFFKNPVLSEMERIKSERLSNSNQLSEVTNDTSYETTDDTMCDVA